MAIDEKKKLPSEETTLPGRDESMQVPAAHFVNGHPLQPPFDEPLEVIYLGLGCFWGAERLFWKLNGVYTTAVGYAGGITRNPTYEEVCSGGTGHTEAVMVVFDSTQISLKAILKHFWESHDPTQGMKQGNDIGTQYRSAIYMTSTEQQTAVEETLSLYQQELNDKGFSAVTTEVRPAPEFYYAEEYHQQYLAKNPAGYCGIGGTGICLPPSLQG